MTKDIILTGIRSNEEPTLGNYLGAIAPMVEMQRKYAGEYQINMFVPDLHSFTTPIDYDKLYDNTLDNLKYFIASGLDLKNKNTYLYRQSYIPAHSELTWILDCFTYVGEMNRMTQFKEKSSQLRIASYEKTLEELSKKYPNETLSNVINSIEASNKASSGVSVGLFNYPVLMAADILLYGAKYVPVGEDQFQHLEIARDIAIRFNNKFGDIFVVPEPTKVQSEFIKRDKGLRIRNLVDPTKKMSKSDVDDKSKILLIDSPELASKKIMSATTDSVGCINFDWDNQPGVSNLLQILAILTNRDQTEVNLE
ncbi:MAG: tryptophan--tRNA ligase, partial [Candidatus Saccharimonadaceae bacterium]|nr:tryptophan--tRNA ligase [Candidatus Saccharimonadaceae bacterium]